MISESSGWQLFTRGPLFEAVQALKLFRDSKTFPDMIPNGFDLADEQKVSELLREFLCLGRNSFLTRVHEFSDGLNEVIRKEELLSVQKLKRIRGLGQGVIDFRSHLTDLIHKYFRGRPETTVVKGLPHDPTFSMEAYIDRLWSVLRRDDRQLPHEMFTGTLIRLDYPYVVTGGRFDEVYYWDCYFTGEGLVLSGGLDLFEGMVKNFGTFIRRNGFIPNGSRRYYLTRSQPPFFYLMVDLIGRMKSKEYLIKSKFELNGEQTNYVELVEQEYQFWMGESALGQDRIVPFNSGAVLNRYWDHYQDPELRPSVQPRPEAYHEDIGSFADTVEGTDAATHFRHIRAATESGWDFSSRWLKPDASGVGRSLATIRTTDIIPIDLNALMYGLERKLHDWTGNTKYLLAAQRRKQLLLQYFWNEELGWFFDRYHSDGQIGQTDVWSLAGAYPLFTQMLDREADRAIIDRMKRTIRERFIRAGGVVTTLLETGQQWDYPNGWAPLQWIVVRGLLYYGERDLALEIARRFVKCVGRTYLREGLIMEKYNVCEPEVIAGGGEYVVQHGFGWTNGVVKAFLVEFRQEFEQDEQLKRHLG